MVDKEKGAKPQQPVDFNTMQRAELLELLAEEEREIAKLQIAYEAKKQELLQEEIKIEEARYRARKAFDALGKRMGITVVDATRPATAPAQEKGKTRHRSTAEEIKADLQKILSVAQALAHASPQHTFEVETLKGRVGEEVWGNGLNWVNRMRSAAEMEKYGFTEYALRADGGTGSAGNKAPPYKLVPIHAPAPKTPPVQRRKKS